MKRINISHLNTFIYLHIIIILISINTTKKILVIIRL
uniref:Uncharacterized protein n=1 Tax=Lepeophtheirus salmonis TaxID=72036 RepID=A0A0K2U1E3_LEPSM